MPAAATMLIHIEVAKAKLSVNAFWPQRLTAAIRMVEDSAAEYQEVARSCCRVCLIGQASRNAYNGVRLS